MLMKILWDFREMEGEADVTNVGKERTTHFSAFLNCFQLFTFPEEYLRKALLILVYKGSTWGLAQMPELFF